MSNVANRRTLLVAVQALVKTNVPNPEHYGAVQAALAAVASDDFGAPLRVVFMNAKPTAKDQPA